MSVLKAEHPISGRTLEARASAMLRRHFLTRELKLPIAAERVADLSFGLQISWESLGPEQPGAVTLGCLRPDGHQIVLNDHARPYFGQYPGTENYTVAHELGHWDLHVTPAPAHAELFSVEKSPASAIVCTNQGSSLRERQAERFAAYLLMPEDLLRQACDGRDLSQWSGLYRLRDDLQVSITTLCIRLKELQILEVRDREIVLLGGR